MFESGTVLRSKKAPSRRVAVITSSRDFVSETVSIMKNNGLEVDIFDAQDILSEFAPAAFAASILNASALDQVLLAGTPTAITEADTWFIDWADDFAVPLIRVKPASKKLIVRVHSYESFSWYPYAIDWNLVDGLIFVSDAIRRVFFALHGTRASGVPNVVSRISQDDTFQVYPPRNKEIGMLKFADENKDPFFALDLLDLLCTNDPSWTLRFAGPGWARSKKGRYLESRLESEILKRGLSTNVYWDGYQTDPQFWFSNLGFVISCSKREGSHQALVEGISAGCFPLIRDWPMLRGFGGARAAYPELSDFIVNSPAEMALSARNALKLEKINIIETEKNFRADSFLDLLI